ncbi:MAG: hypothetical protein OXT72_11465 [Gammaproteobacteria bacterium]|nr:hypothetical protein [Gammaproteobacteria bacterium]MDE0246603.1 hypothetical protein [Gammaproteobacteria bacterium]
MLLDQSKDAKEKDGFFTGEARDPLEEALNVLSIALRSQYGPAGAVTRLRETAAKIQGRQSVRGIVLSDISPWDTISWKVIGQPKHVERLKSMGKKNIDWYPSPEHPETEELADTIRACPMIPPDLVDYLADRLEKPPSRPAHRPSKHPREKWLEAQYLAFEVAIVEAGFKLQRVRPAKAKAIEVVARRVYMSHHTLRDRIYRDLPRAPKHYQSLTSSKTDTLELVCRAVAAGDIHLDEDEGIRWPDDG